MVYFKDDLIDFLKECIIFCVGVAYSVGICGYPLVVGHYLILCFSVQTLYGFIKDSMVLKLPDIFGWVLICDIKSSSTFFMKLNVLEFVTHMFRIVMLSRLIIVRY